MFKRIHFTLLSTKWAHFKFDACYRSQKSWHGGKKGLKKQYIVEYFKNNVPQRQIVIALQISSSTVHNIIKRWRETGEISVCKGQGRRPLLDARGLRALRQHCITNDSVIDITKWAQEYFQKPHFSKHNPLCHLQMPTKALSWKREAIFKYGQEAPSCPVV